MGFTDRFTVGKVKREMHSEENPEMQLIFISLKVKVKREMHSGENPEMQLIVISLKVKVKREMHSRKSLKMQSVISFPELKEEVKVKILKCSLTKKLYLSQR